MSKFAIAGLQLALGFEDNMATIEREIALTMVRFPWVNMIVLGELAPAGPVALNAKPLPNADERRFQHLAEEHGIWIVNGSTYEKAGDQIFNTCSVIDDRGRVIGRYRKMYPFLPYEKNVEGGSDFLVFDVNGVGRFGVSICYDMWFPETTRTLAWMGAEAIIHPTLTNTIDRDIELSIVRATAAMNQVYVVDINSAAPLAYGRSIVAGPNGRVLYQAGDQQEVIPLTLDFDHVRDVRERGLLGLGQPLKSFRDGPSDFPVYSQGASASLAFKSMGPLEMPDRLTPSPPHAGREETSE
ncbi:MAG: carbon-nitrogen hydrolase family protein [Pseudomonadota bacterium]